MRIFADCPKCESNLTYKDGSHLVCAECTHEWPLEGATATVVVTSNLPARSSSKALINALEERGSSMCRARKSIARNAATQVSYHWHDKAWAR